MRFLIADGKILEKKDFQVPEEYLDAQLRLSQKLWYGYGGIPLFAENLTLLKRQVVTLGIPFPREFENSRELFRLVKRMLNKNRFYRSGHVHIQITAGPGSLHTLISCTSFTGFTWAFVEEGLLVAFSSQKKYTHNHLNRMPWFNEKLWQAALAEVQKTSFHQAIILNENNGVCECPFSSIFILSGNELITPSYKSGCHESAFRGVVIEAAANLGFTVKEPVMLSKKELREADEIFCVSEEWGMQWLMGIEQQRYIRYYSDKINEELNVLLKQKAASNPL